MGEKAPNKCLVRYQVSGFIVLIVGIVVLVVGAILLTLSVPSFSPTFVSISLGSLISGTIITVVGYRISRCEEVSPEVIKKIGR